MQQPQRLVRNGRPWRQGLTGFGYGLGLFAGQHDVQGRVVFHSGGLPGFGSHVEWLPDCGVGVIGFANLTYAPMRQAVGQVLAILDGAGALTRRRVAPSPQLVAARELVISLYASRDEGRLSAQAASNLFLDRALAVRKEELVALREQYGRCCSARPLLPEGDLRWNWELLCERGTIKCRVWLSPTPDPRIQMLSLEPVPSG